MSCLARLLPQGEGGMLLTKAPCSDQGTKERHFRLSDKEKKFLPSPMQTLPPLPQLAFCFLISLLVTSPLTHSCPQLLSPGTNKTLQHARCACQLQVARHSVILLDPYPPRHLDNKTKLDMH